MYSGGPPSSMMIICEVCETPQLPATVCAECGMALKLPRGVRPIADPPIEAVPGLELTSYEPVPALPMARVPDFEVTVPARAPDVLPDYVPGFETTAPEEFLELPGGLDEVVPGIERTVEEFERTPMGPTDLPANCPYCGFVQPSGKVCNNCGRSRLRVIPSGSGARGRPGDEPGTVRCRGCGATVKHYKVCSDCGNALPPLE